MRSRRSFALLLSLVAAPVLAAQPQCKLVLSSGAVRPTPAAPSANSRVPASASTSATSTPTPTPFVPFAYGSEPVRGVNLYVLFNAGLSFTQLEVI